MKKIFAIIACVGATLSANATIVWGPNRADQIGPIGTVLYDDPSLASISTGANDSTKTYAVDAQVACFPDIAAVEYYLPVRVTDAPSESNPEGTAYTDTDLQAASIIVAATSNVDVTLYYKLSSPSKAVYCYDQTTKESVSITQSPVSDEGGYFFEGIYKFQANHTYTIYGRGGTVFLYAIGFAEGTYVEPSNKVYGYEETETLGGYNTISYSDGATLALTGNTSKSFGSGSAIDGTTSIKNSNGAEMTFTAPEGKQITKVTFKAVTNDAATNGILKTINDETINDTVESLKDFTIPTSYTYNFENVSSFRFTYGTKQVYFVLDVTYYVDSYDDPSAPWDNIPDAPGDEEYGKGGSAGVPFGEDMTKEEIAEYVGATMDVQLKRTFYKDGGSNTICLPFSLSAEQLAASPLKGYAKLQEFSSASVADKGTDRQSLELTMTDATAIEAGKPYVISWAGGDNIIDPVFEGVTVTADEAAQTKSSNGVSFCGSFTQKAVSANDKGIMFIDADGQLSWPDENDSIKGFRCYFKISND